jgi:hypothetical protein
MTSQCQKKQEKKETTTGLNSPPRTQSTKSQQCRTLNGETCTCHTHDPHAKLLNIAQETDREVHELGIQKGSQMGWHHMKMHKLLNTAIGSNVSYLNHICTGKFFFFFFFTMTRKEVRDRKSKRYVCQRKSNIPTTEIASQQGNPGLSRRGRKHTKRGESEEERKHTHKKERR